MRLNTFQDDGRKGARETINQVRVPKRVLMRCISSLCMPGVDACITLTVATIAATDIGWVSWTSRGDEGIVPNKRRCAESAICCNYQVLVVFLQLT